MNKLKNWLKNKNNKPTIVLIIMGICLIVVIILLIYPKFPKINNPFVKPIKYKYEKVYLKDNFFDVPDDYAAYIGDNYEESDFMVYENNEFWDIKLRRKNDKIPPLLVYKNSESYCIATSGKIEPCSDFNFNNKQGYPYVDTADNSPKKHFDWNCGAEMESFKNNELLGCKNAKGKIVIQAIYQDLLANKENIIAKKQNTYYLLDLNGKNLTPEGYPIYKAKNEYEDDMATIIEIGEKRYLAVKNNLKYLMNEKGQIIKQVDFDDEYGSEEMDYYSHNNESGSYHYFSKNYEGDYLQVCKNLLCGIMDKNGNTVISYQYQYILTPIVENRENQIFLVKKDDKWGLIDYKNKIVVPILYNTGDIFGEDTVYFNKENEALIANSNGLIKDIKGNIDPLSVSASKNILFTLNLNNKIGIIDKNGVILVKPQYDPGLFWINGHDQYEQNYYWYEPDGFILKRGEYYDIYRFTQNKLNLIEKNVFGEKVESSPEDRTLNVMGKNLSGEQLIYINKFKKIYLVNIDDKIYLIKENKIVKPYKIVKKQVN